MHKAQLARILPCTYTSKYVVICAMLAEVCSGVEGGVRIRVNIERESWVFISAFGPGSERSEVTRVRRDFLQE